jgi:hypothetical protein
LLAAANDFARGVLKGEISKDAAAATLAGIIVAAGVPVEIVAREARVILSAFLNKPRD